MVHTGTLSIWGKLRKAISDQRPQDWIKWVVLLICLVIVYRQLIECCLKLNNPPITSHSKLRLNDSMYYPALTICREPPYNKRVFPKYNFTTDHVGSIPVSSLWKNFPYDNYNISDFWEEAVYREDIFINLDFLKNSVEFESSIHWQNGMCHTLRPNFPVDDVGKKSGYTLWLTHDLYDYRPAEDNEPGWKIYVHEPREKFSEHLNFLVSRQDYVFVPVGEATEISIDAYEFNVLTNCTNAENYSVTECEVNCTIQKNIAPNVECSGPWLPQLKKPHCKNYSEMRLLLKASNEMKYRNCCSKNCRTTHYKIFVIKRTALPLGMNLSSIAQIYFSSKAVITMEEMYSYSWGDFLGEIGGTVGFLLGLSIVGVIGILDKTIRFFFCSKEEKMNTYMKNITEVPTVDGSIMSKAPTVEVAENQEPKI